ncbi:Essential protein Yae1, N terminal [Elasticomyces elasticus]|nr:Essential protein Yae1, N terminal [Elasticomyces elasticus]
MDDISFADTEEATAGMFESQHDQLDDVFGSRSPSPLHNEETTTDTLHGPSNAASPEHSDIARLRSTHTTNGYRDGISESKAKFVQEGFDEGYSLGAVLGLRAGWILGVLEELKTQALFGQQYFGPDGIWLYALSQHNEDQEDVTFVEVANAHPLLQNWEASIMDLVKSLALDLSLYGPFPTEAAQ